MWLAEAAGGAAWPPLAVAAVFKAWRLPLPSAPYYGWWAADAACGAAWAAGFGLRAQAAGHAASLLVALALWWRSRRRRNRAPRSLGAKARARVAALMRSMPRVAPRIRPQGAPA